MLSPTRCHPQASYTPVHQSTHPFKPFCCCNTDLASRLMTSIRAGPSQGISKLQFPQVNGTTTGPQWKKVSTSCKTNISLLSHPESNVFPAQPLSLRDSFSTLSQFLSVSQMTAVWSFTLLLNCSWVLGWFYSSHGWKAFIHWVR